MGTYTLEELLRRWFTHEITPEQAIGQLLQIVQDIERRVKEIEERGRRGPLTPIGSRRP